ncbi:MAG TPA: calcium-binding protein, partial [Actinomycetota bacterium]|nr:calcium-binding protein [Actinomycetota bacterium]
MRISSRSRASRRVITAAFATTLALLFLPATSASAAASSVSVVGSTIVVNAAGATKNTVTIAGNVQPFTVIDNAGATPGTGCVQGANGRTVTCSGAITDFDVSLGDLDDTLISISALDVAVNGGTGKDTLNTGNGDDAVSGGADNDSMNPGNGDDVVSGGDGTDLVTYSSRTLAIDVSLDNVAGDGEGTENDNIMDDVENLTTPGTDDTIIGSSADNVINSGGGTDSIDGLGGNDTLNGGLGTDVILGGAGTA